MTGRCTQVSSDVYKTSNTLGDVCKVAVLCRSPDTQVQKNALQHATTLGGVRVRGISHFDETITLLM